MLATEKKSRSLLGLKELSKEEIQSILDRAAYWENHENRTHSILNGKFISNMFFENSTRTRTSFEVAQKRLGAEVINFSAAASSVEKGESIYDTVRTLESMGMDAGVIRLKPIGLLAEMAQKIKVPLINAGDGNNEHPTQALLDLYTMQKQFGNLKGLRVAIIGDILHSRVARSNLWALQKFGAEVVFCAPDNMKATDLNVTYVGIDEAIKADVVMMLRVQLERHSTGMLNSAEAYNASYGLTMERAAKMSEHSIIMHPAPVNRGVEIDSDLVEHPKSKIFSQMQNGVPIRMAVIERAMV